MIYLHPPPTASPVRVFERQRGGLPSAACVGRGGGFGERRSTRGGQFLLFFPSKTEWAVKLVSLYVVEAEIDNQYKRERQAQWFWPEAISFAGAPRAPTKCADTFQKHRYILLGKKRIADK